MERHRALRGGAAEWLLVRMTRSFGVGRRGGRWAKTLVMVFFGGACAWALRLVR